MNITRVHDLCRAIVILMLLLCGCFVAWNGNDEAQEIVEDDSLIEVYPVSRVLLDSEPKDIACTGIAYDEVNSLFWVGNYGKESPTDMVSKPSILAYDMEFSSVKREINLSDRTNVQGIAIDSSTNSLWFSDTNDIINCSFDGTILSTLSLSKYQRYKPNGIAYDSCDNSLWILYTKKYLIHCDTRGNIIDEIPMNYKHQDHIWIDGEYAYISVGADYHGEKNYVIVFSKSTKSIIGVLKMYEAYAIEGICMASDKMYVSNDGIYHNAMIKKNYINIYQLK